ncbi:unnamed protein product [Peronospora belbahrii]|uniref:Reverse transcriptase Ty1/copia-type domain-containing protein n=1 Tax=Peronospora belbahrii TaxID=622444 RepID=A0AAU9L7C8_9STRA|nr:unnamed protein product [Peronospora belbahrii]
MDGAVVMWTCTKQSEVSLSTMEAEFIFASQAGRELLGLKKLLGELKLRICELMPMCVDNQAAIKQLEHEKSTSSAKHVDIRFKFILHHVREGVVQPRFIKSEDMMADMLTKALPAPRMEDLRTMFNHPGCSRGGVLENIVFDRLEGAKGKGYLYPVPGELQPHLIG